MFSIERTRQLLGGAPDLRDEEVARLRDELYVLAEFAVDSYLASRRRGTVPKFMPKNTAPVHRKMRSAK